jgi:hypothetical protein
MLDNYFACPFRESTRRIERVLDPSLLEKDAEAAKNLPIWAR